MLPLRFHGWKLCGLHACSEENRLDSLTDRSQVRMWLRSVKADASRIAAMRSLLSRDGSAHVARMSNDAVIDAIAELLARGRLHVHAAPMSHTPTTASAPVETAHVPFPFSDRQPRAPAVLNATRLSNFRLVPTNVDLAQQAATLVAAAEKGTPFCRMCARASG